MDDNEIIKLYFDRSEEAINQTKIKYGKLCRSVSYSILGNNLDVDECENDTYLKLWQSIPPERPISLSSYIGTFAKNFSLSRLRTKKKIYSHEIEEICEEMWECVPSGYTPEDEFNKKKMLQLLNEFLEVMDESTRRIYMYRYWYGLSYEEISVKENMTQGNVRTILWRTRKKLRELFKKEGFI